jgi:uncharacterized membrane protein
LPVGGIILLAAAALVFLGFAHRILDRMHLTDGQAIVVLILMAVLSLVNVTVSRANPRVILNIGGIVVPIGLVIYVLVRATAAEKARSLLTAVATGAVLYGISKTFDFEEGQQIIAPIYLWGLVSGVLAYVGTRSRRTAFVTGILGVVALDIANLIEVIVRDLPTTVYFGGAGVFDSVVVAGIVSAVLAEGFGEAVERIGGARHEHPEIEPELADTGQENGRSARPGANVVELRHRNENGGGRDE